MIAPPPLATPATPATNAALIQSMLRDCARVEADRAKPPPATVRARLERLEYFDQAGREALSRLVGAKLEGADVQALQRASAVMFAKDLADQAELKTMIPRTGWFTRKAYGRKAALGAWLVVDHAVNDPALMRDVVARLKPLAVARGFEGTQYAIMSDRIALTFDHRKQRYGTQVECRAGAWRPADLETPAGVDARRRAVGFTETEAEYLKTFADDPCS